jgi:hypothetical protein
MCDGAAWCGVELRAAKLPGVAERPCGRCGGRAAHTALTPPATRTRAPPPHPAHTHTHTRIAAPRRRAPPAPPTCSAAASRPRHSMSSAAAMGSAPRMSGTRRAMSSSASHSRRLALVARRVCAWCVCVLRGGGGGREGGRVCWRALVCACVHVCASFGGGRSGGRITPHHMARRTRAHTTPGVSAARAPHLSKSSTASTAVSSRRMELAWHAARTSGNTMNALALCGHSGGGVCHVCVRVWLCADGCADVCCWVCCVCARRAALRACGAGVAHAHAHAHPAVHGAHLARCCTSRATQSPACPRCR